MGDTWQYRVRVSGPDRAKWKKKATKPAFGGRRDGYYSWPMVSKLGNHAYGSGGIWYNVALRETDKYVELLGNFSGTPGLFFEKKSKFTDDFRKGRALFDGLDIKVEIVGHSWSCDSKTGVYSYREVYKRGKRTQHEKSENEKVAQRCAPEMLKEFPDENTPEERAEWAREALEYEEEESRRKREAAEEKRLTWQSLRPGAFVEIRQKGSASTPKCHVVEHVDVQSAVFRHRLIGHDFDGATLRLSLDDDFSIRRVPPYCEHGEDLRTRTVCTECEGLRRLVERDIKYMLDGLRARVVL